MTREKRKPVRWELAAVVTLFGAENDHQHLHINRVLHDNPNSLRVNPVEVRSGSYVLPVVDRKSGEEFALAVPDEVVDMKRFGRYFRKISSVLAPSGEITDLVGKPAREAWEGVLELRKGYGNPKELHEYAEFNTEDGLIHGMSDLRNLVLLNMYLEKKGARTLTHREGMEEDRKGNLSNGVWRQFGLGVFSPKGYYNRELADYFVREGERRGYKTPILLHYSVMNLSEDGRKVLFSKDFDKSLVVSGNEARVDLEKFNWVGDSSARRLYRDGVGGWNAYWGGMFGSDRDCRVDKICGRATRSKK